MPHACRIFALGVFAIPVLLAQKPGPAGSKPGNPSGSTAPEASQPSASPDNPWPESQVPALLSGTVVIEGNGPAANVAVERLCSGNLPHTVAWTNTSGQFSFQWNNSSGVITEASDAGLGTGAHNGSGTGLPGVNMMGCELTVNAPGYRSDRVDLSTRRPADSPDLGTILLHRTASVEGLAVSATALSAPKDARKAWEKGVQLLRRKDQPDAPAAEKEFEKAVIIYPKYANAWLDLGRAREMQSKEEPAREAFLKATDADGKLVEPYIELGAMAARRQAWPEAAHYLDHALQLNPVDYPHLWYDDAEADYNIQDFDRAEKKVREALKMPPPSLEPRAIRLLGLVLLSKQDYAGASAALRAYLRRSPDAQDWDEVKTKLESIDARLAATH